MKMIVVKHCILFFGVLAGIAGCMESGQSGKSANKLFVEVSKKVKQANKETRYSKSRALKIEAANLIKTIVDKHPDHELAVKIASGQKIGDVDPKALENFANKVACEVKPTKKCLIEISMATLKKKWAHGFRDAQVIDGIEFMFNSVREYSEGNEQALDKLLEGHLGGFSSQSGQRPKIDYQLMLAAFTAVGLVDEKVNIIESAIRLVKKNNPDKVSELKKQMTQNLTPVTRDMKKHKQLFRERFKKGCKVVKGEIDQTEPSPKYKKFVELYCAKKLVEAEDELGRIIAQPDAISAAVLRDLLALEPLFWVQTRNPDGKDTKFKTTPVPYILATIVLIMQT